jgi:hypothetical protein
MELVAAGLECGLAGAEIAPMRVDLLVELIAARGRLLRAAQEPAGEPLPADGMGADGVVRRRVGSMAELYALSRGRRG